MFPTIGTTGPEWTLEYTSTPSSTSIVGGLAAITVIVAVILIIVIFNLRKRPKDKKGK